MPHTSRRQLVAVAVRNELKAQGLTVAWLAERTGIPAPDLHARLGGEVAFDVDQLEAIASALHVNFERLLGPGL